MHSSMITQQALTWPKLDDSLTEALAMNGFTEPTEIQVSPSRGESPRPYVDTPLTFAPGPG